MTRKILVVDDDEAIRLVLRASLEFTTGWRVLTAASGKEALEIACAEQPDAILLDVMMPEMDGIALFHQLQLEPLAQAIPAIFLTAQARDAERKALAALGKGVILKPFEPTAIAQQIRTLLHWPA
ncbi:MAG: response regulator [Cyanobacteria bacterium J06597_16]